MSEIKGPFEAFGSAIAGAVGLYIGYKLGAEAVEYAKTITENSDTLSYIINQHPILTKLAATLGAGELMSHIGRVPGIIFDKIAKTRDPNFNLEDYFG